MAPRRTAKARRFARIALASALGALGLARSSADARAQQGFALSRFEPAPAGDRLLGVPSPYSAGSPGVRGIPLHLMLLADYAHDPLVLRGATSGSNLGEIVSDQVVMHLNGSFALFDRFTLNVDVPAALQTGSAPSGGGLSFARPSAAGLGDIRFGARLTLYGGYFDPLQIAVSGLVWVPSGSRDAYAGDGGMRGEPQLVVGGYVDRRLVWSAAAGPQFRPAIPFANIRPGTSLEWGLGAGVLIDEDRVFQVGPQITGSIDVGDLQARTTGVEALLAGRRRFAGDFEAGGGLGVGLTPGAGTPSLRAVLMLAYSPEVLPFVPKKAEPDRDRDGVPDARDACPGERGPRSDDPRTSGCPASADRDGDGITDAADACPGEGGPFDLDPQRNGCPPAGDRDGDGVPDADDACPDSAGPADPDPRKNGCLPPSDRDGDGVPDELDACPDVSGVATTDNASNGCPGDRDGDGVADVRDACPRERGPADPSPEKNGCPALVRVTDAAVVLLQPVQFEGNTAAIRPASKALLDQIAGVLADHPEVVRIEVQGHTDNKGAKTANTLLSQRRAEAVIQALVKRGVAAVRLLARGYGPDRPIAANLTTEGRAKNRRIEIKILETQGK